jgi:DNA-binding transcriptional ArsR family regulator
MIGMVAVKHLNVDSGLSHATGNSSQLPRNGLRQFLDNHFPFSGDLNRGVHQCAAGRGCVLHEEMRHAFALDDEGAAALDAYAGAAKGFAHLGQRTGLVRQQKGQVFHRSIPMAASGLVTHGQFAINQSMNAEPDLARVARTIGDSTRIRMLTLLMEGRAHTAKELAHGAGVDPATATAHLRRLREDSLVTWTSQGRYKYFRLASTQVARCIESLLVIAGPPRTEAGAKPEPLHLARFCYDHLAGRLGTRMTGFFVEQRLLLAEGKDFLPTPKGRRWFAAFGVEVDALGRARRKIARACLDWSERSDHLAGALGAEVARRMVEAGWLKRRPGTRVVLVTTNGARALRTHFGINWPEQG